MLARNWKRIGLIILIVACFANITAKFVKSVSFNDNVKSTVTNVINTVDGTVKNIVGSDETIQNQTAVDNSTNNQVINTNEQTNIVSQPITVDPTQNQVNTQNSIVIEENTDTVQ